MAGIIQLFGDGLRNVAANLLTSRDKAYHSQYVYSALSPDQIDAAYRGAWLPRKIVDIPAFDATRKWRQWSATAEQISAIEAEEKRLGIQVKTLRRLIMSRLRGGAALLIGDGASNPALPLDVDRIGLGGLRYVTALAKSQLQAGPLDLDIGSEWYNEPKYWILSDRINREVEIHPSRLVLFKGADKADDIFDGEDGWGDSVLEAIHGALKQADSTAANIASLVFEAKIDVIKIPGLMESLGRDGFDEALALRLSTAATLKGNNGALVLDGDEDYQQKSASFATLPDILDRFYQAASGAADIPMTRLFGLSPGGLNATGESDLKNYYDRIQSMQELEIGTQMHRLDEALIRSALGSRPEEIFYTWRSLWQMTEKEKAEIGSLISKTGKTLQGILPPEVVAEATANALIESGSMPGLEASIDEHGLDGVGPSDDEIMAAAQLETNQLLPELRVVGDAKPRTLYVRRDVLNGAEIIKWAKAQGFMTTLPASDMHVTIAFSRAELDWMKTGQSWEGRMEVGEGGPRIVEKFDGGAVVLLFSHHELEWRHKAIIEAGATWDHPEYQPHVTISYSADSPAIDAIEPYTGRIVLGPEIFEELNPDWKSTVKET